MDQVDRGGLSEKPQLLGRGRRKSDSERGQGLGSCCWTKSPLPIWLEQPGGKRFPEAVYPNKGAEMRPTSTSLYGFELNSLPLRPELREL